MECSLDGIEAAQKPQGEETGCAWEGKADGRGQVSIMAEQKQGGKGKWNGGRHHGGPEAGRCS